MNEGDLTKQFHLAGVVPIAGPPMGLNFPWHDCCMPIAQNYLAIERAVVECAYAGCETIWIVCNDDVHPLVRHRLGEYINDPVWAIRPQDPNQIQKRRRSIWAKTKSLFQKSHYHPFFASLFSYIINS